MYNLVYTFTSICMFFWSPVAFWYRKNDRLSYTVFWWCNTARLQPTRSKHINTSDSFFRLTFAPSLPPFGSCPCVTRDTYSVLTASGNFRSPPGYRLYKNTTPTLKMEAIYSSETLVWFTYKTTRIGTLIVATIYLQLIQNRYMIRSFTVLHCSHQHCVQPVASDVEVVGYI